MFKAARAFAVVFNVCVLLVGLTLVANAAASVTWRVRGSNFIKDADGTTNLAVGSYVQLWDVTNDVLLDEAAIGLGFFPPAGAGQFSKAGVNLPAGTYTLNIRAYNRPKATANDPGSCSGASASQVLVTTDISIHTLDFSGFSTTTCQPTAVHLTMLRGWSPGNEGVVLFSMVMAVSAILGLGYRRRHAS